MELTKIKGNSYYIKSGTNIGVFVFKNKNCLLIDTGINNTVARKIDETLINNNLHPKYIINTHSHLDHCGGNNYFVDTYPGCVTYASKKEKLFMENVELRPYTFCNSSPLKDIKTNNKPIKADYLLQYGTEKINDEKIEVIPLSGHSIEHIGIVTPEKVCFLGDSIFSEDILDKYSFPYLYDVEDALNSLNTIKQIDSDFFVIGHATKIYSKEEMLNLVDHNIENINKYCDQCLELLDQPLTKEGLLQNICILNELSLDFHQYFINLSAISAFITYLYNKNLLETSVEDGCLYYYKKL